MNVIGPNVRTLQTRTWSRALFPLINISLDREFFMFFFIFPNQPKKETKEINNKSKHVSVVRYCLSYIGVFMHTTLPYNFLCAYCIHSAQKIV